MKSFGTFLKYARKQRGLTQEQVAEKLNIVTPVLSKWENDKAVPSLDMLCKLCNALSVSIEECVAAEIYEGEHALPPEIYDPVRLGETVKDLRIKNDWSQAELGKKLFVTSQTVSKWESGGISSLETLVKIAELFGMTPTELLNGLERVRAIPKNNTTAEQPKKFNKFVLKVTAIVLAVIIFLCAVAGLIIGLVLKGNGDDAPDGDKDNPFDDKNNPFTNYEFRYASPIKQCYRSGFYSTDPNYLYLEIQDNFESYFYEVVCGAEVYAAADGIVESRDEFSLTINHGFGVMAVYKYMKPLDIEVGSKVERDQIIGKSSDQFFSLRFTINGESAKDSVLYVILDVPDWIIRPSEYFHDWDEWQFDGDSHFRGCACGEASQSEKHTFDDDTCTVCGYKKSET